MKKRLALFLLAVVLAAAALLGGSPKVEAARCHRPDCFASPGCCSDRDCDDWCGGRGFGVCSGGCCSNCAG